MNKKGLPASRRGFTTIIAIIIAVLVVGGVVYVAQTRKVSAPVEPVPGTPPPVSSLPSHDSRFTAILNRNLPETYTISYVFPDKYDRQTTAIYNAPGHFRTDMIYDSISADLGKERRIFVTPTQYTQCADLPDGWLCYRDPSAIAPGGGDWITYFVPNSLPRGVGYGPGRYDPGRLAQIEVTFVGSEKIAGRDTECFAFRIPILGPRPNSKTCFDTGSGLMMKADQYNNLPNVSGEFIPGNVATALSFDPIPTSVFELPKGAIIETQLTDRIRSVFSIGTAG